MNGRRMMEHVYNTLTEYQLGKTCPGLDRWNWNVKWVGQTEVLAWGKWCVIHWGNMHFTWERSIHLVNRKWKKAWLVNNMEKRPGASYLSIIKPTRYSGNSRGQRYFEIPGWADSWEENCTEGTGLYRTGGQRWDKKEAVWEKEADTVVDGHSVSDQVIQLFVIRSS